MNAVLDPLAEIMQALQDHLQNGHRPFAGAPVSHVTCGDGTVLSVQAGHYHYCEPRDNTGPWSHVEVMVIHGGAMRYFEAEDGGDPAGRVPLRAVAQEIHSRGQLHIDHRSLEIKYLDVGTFN